MPHWHNRSLAQTVEVGDPPKSLLLLWDAIERQVPSLCITTYLFEYLLIPLFWISHGSTKTSLTMEPFLILFFFKRSEFSYIPRLDNSMELFIFLLNLVLWGKKVLRGLNIFFYWLKGWRVMTFCCNSGHEWKFSVFKKHYMHHTPKRFKVYLPT